MPRLFSYVVDHDHGYAPNPSNGICSLVHCKFGGLGGKRNIVEMAQVGDWVLGSGGTGRHTAGNGKIIYAMRIDEKIPFSQYLADPAYAGRADCLELGHGNLFALISRHYFYFGRNALNVKRLPNGIERARLFKYGMGYRRDLPPAQVCLLTDWLGRTFRTGLHGQPCSGELPEADGRLKPRRRCVFRGSFADSPHRKNITAVPSTPTISFQRTLDPSARPLPRPYVRVKCR